MRWPRDAQDWPLTEHSRFVLCRPHRWHVQQAGQGPTVLLLHGAGAATQSWRGLFPLFAREFTTIAVDLPGQGFTQSGGRMRCGLGPMTEDLHALITAEGWRPDALIGHSAGAALALALWERLDRPEVRVVGLNASLGTFDGVAGWLFPVLAKLLALNPLTATLFSATSATPARVRKLIEGTGSHLDARGLELYRRLVADRAHVDATLSMMAQWDLGPLLSRLETLRAPTLLIASEGDRAVPPDISVDAARRMPDARAIVMPSLGHLAHEEDPEAVFPLVRAFLTQTGGTANGPVPGR